MYGLVTNRPVTKATNMRTKKGSGKVVYMAVPCAGKALSSGAVMKLKMGSTTVQQSRKPTPAAMKQRTRRQRSSLR